MHDLTAVAKRAAARHGLLTLDDLASVGLAAAHIDRWVATGRLVRLGYGVYRVGGAPQTFAADVLAAILVLPGETWASHRTAASLWRLPGFEGRQQIELTRTPRLSVRRRGVRVHRSTTIPAHHVTVTSAIPVTTLSRTIFDLARATPKPTLDRAIEGALRTDLCSITSLYRVLYDLGGRGRPGTARMRECLDWRGHSYVPTESELDLVGRALLRDVPGIEWQVPFSDERGYIRRVDGFHRGAGLVIEWDGEAFHAAPAQRELDAAQDERLRSLGLDVVRFGWDDVRSGHRVRDVIFDRLALSAA